MVACLYAKKRLESADRYNIDKHHLAPLSVGDSVSIQNRTGSHPLRWDRTGTVVERLEHRQYLVKSDGSGRVLRRTRAHLRRIDQRTRTRGVMQDRPSEADASVPSDDTTPDAPLLIPGRLQDGTEVIDPIDPAEDIATATEGPINEPVGISEPQDAWQIPWDRGCFMITCLFAIRGYVLTLRG